VRRIPQSHVTSAHQATRDAGPIRRIDAAPSCVINRYGGDEIKTREQALLDEFDDLEEEFFFCASREARCRCAGRMGAILAELGVL
jgi:hypothetical protein